MAVCMCGFMHGSESERVCDHACACYVCSASTFAVPALGFRVWISAPKQALHFTDLSVHSQLSCWVVAL